MACNIVLYSQHTQSARFDKKLRNLLDFSVQTIDVDSAYEKMTKYTFLDTREPKEFEVSHINGAIHTGYKDFQIDKLQDIPKDTPIILYCSVGYRSEKIGVRLKKAGYTNVYNLYGSIFEWVNRGYPVRNREGPATSVHTYNKNWSQWLEHPGIKKIW